MASSPVAPFVNVPSNELFPTMMTGVDPTMHGVWGVRIHPELKQRLRYRMIDLIPDILTTSWQCARHYLTGNCDLAAIPPRRRRRFLITRTKYKRRQKHPDALHSIGGCPTVFDVIGPKHSCYRFSSSPDPEKNLLALLCDKNMRLEVLELYTLDRYQQWYGDDERAIERLYVKVDEFLEKLKQRCDQSGKLLMVLTDHGHEPIREHVDLITRLRQIDASDREYTHFVEVSSARFWFHTERARESITTMLNEIPRSRLVRYDEMHRFGIPLTDGTFGELHIYLNPGCIFFPHDFNHPLANIFMALTDPLQRSRLPDPRHRGNHGHLPYFDAEYSMMILCSEHHDVTLWQGGTILDVAPSILSLLGASVPATMRGRPLFGPMQVA